MGRGRGGNAAHRGLKAKAGREAGVGGRGGDGAPRAQHRAMHAARILADGDHVVIPQRARVEKGARQRRRRTRDVRDAPRGGRPLLDRDVQRARDAAAHERVERGDGRREDEVHLEAGGALHLELVLALRQDVEHRVVRDQRERVGNRHHASVARRLRLVHREEVGLAPETARDLGMKLEHGRHLAHVAVDEKGLRLELGRERERRVGAEREVDTADEERLKLIRREPEGEVAVLLVLPWRGLQLHHDLALEFHVQQQHQRREHRRRMHQVAVRQLLLDRDHRVGRVGERAQQRDVDGQVHGRGHHVAHPGAGLLDAAQEEQPRVDLAALEQRGDASVAFRKEGEEEARAGGLVDCEGGEAHDERRCRRQGVLGRRGLGEHQVVRL